MMAVEGDRGAYRRFGEIVKRGEYVCGALRCHFEMARFAMMTFFSVRKDQSFQAEDNKYLTRTRHSRSDVQES